MRPDLAPRAHARTRGPRVSHEDPPEDFPQGAWLCREESPAESAPQTNEQLTDLAKTPLNCGRLHSQLDSGSKHENMTCTLRAEPGEQHPLYQGLGQYKSFPP